MYLGGANCFGCPVAGFFETVISNERLHAALTAPAFHLVTALVQQIAGADDSTGAGQQAAGQPRGSGSTHGSQHRAESMERAESAGSATRVNVCVMEGVQEDAYRRYRAARCPEWCSHVHSQRPTS